MHQRVGRRGHFQPEVLALLLRAGHFLPREGVRELVGGTADFAVDYWVILYFDVLDGLSNYVFAEEVDCSCNLGDLLGCE